MSLQNALPIPVFPGFTHYGVVAPAVKEIATTFNAESLDALASVPEKQIAWADVGTKVTPGVFEVKIPWRLPSSMAFKPFDGSRSYGKLDVAAPAVRVTPFDLNFEWPMAIQGGVVQLKEFYGVEGLAQQIVSAGRAYKAQLVASLLYNGFTNSNLSVTASVSTIPQPGLANGNPLFVDGTQTKHYAHPFNANSGRFANLFLGAGTFQAALPTVLTNMSQVPHPTLPNLTMGLQATDFIGPTSMLTPFYQAAIQNLSLQTTTSPGNLAAATTNPYSKDAIDRAMNSGTFIGASGIAPWRFWIAPQLDNHPYIVANPTKQMWVAVARDEANPRAGTWAELAGPSKDFTPTVTLFGDSDPESRKLRMVRMISDLDGGAAAGLYHRVQMYFETTP